MPITITPTGRLKFPQDLDLSANIGDWAAVREAFEKDSAHGLLALAAAHGSRSAWPQGLPFWREFVDALLTEFSRLPEGERAVEDLDAARAVEFTLSLPGGTGAEYASPEWFITLWQELAVRVAEASQPDPAAWLRKLNPAFHLLGRVTLHLAENKRSPDKPFAFMATFTHRLSAAERPVHLPLAKALSQYAGSGNKAALKTVLQPLNTAAESSDWMKNQLDSRNIFKAQAWTAVQAYEFLKNVEAFEEAGLSVRIPNWWRSRSSSGVKVNVQLGDKPASSVGAKALLDFKVETTMGGEPLSMAELKEILAAGTGIVALRGQWVEVNQEKIAAALEHWEKLKRQAGADGIPLLEGMRMLAGVRLGGDSDDGEEIRKWTKVEAGEWLGERLRELREPEADVSKQLAKTLHATLRAYQNDGVAWLNAMTRLQLGACLADDMGLGKTIQIIALLLMHKMDRKQAGGEVKPPSLLIVPASLLANWKQEIERFAPQLKFTILHPSEHARSKFDTAAKARRLIKGLDLAITTYSMASRNAWMAEAKWHLLVLDEAQAIKNPGTKQTRAIKKLPADSRIALTGTPIENNLGDLWSLFDFLNPGLLGSSRAFSSYTKRLNDYSPLRRLVSPYLLRRMKTDKSIIADLPDKTEVNAWCLLSKRQAALYQSQVEELARVLEEMRERREAGETAGMQQRGLVLGALTRFKQICNHPSQLLKDDAFKPTDSGKFARLEEICSEIASRQEKVLVFTQFQEMCEPLADFLRKVFGRPGLILHGGIPVKRRKDLVSAFQQEDGPPFFILSLRAGGTGLTLTAASHVVHFDRWWNPAVENQATDRAFRIGQKRNVMVHKFVCKGTIEERINELIESKVAVADAVIGAKDGAGKLLLDMSDKELLDFVALDLTSLQS